MTDHDKSSEFAPEEIARFAELDRAAARAAVVKKAELLAWAYERQAAREAAAHEATLPKREPAPAKRIQGAEMTQAWQSYIADRIERSERQTIRACMKAAGELLGKDIVELEKRCAQLESEIRELKDRETTRRLRAVPSTPPDAMISR